MYLDLLGLNKEQLGNMTCSLLLRTRPKKWQKKKKTNKPQLKLYTIPKICFPQQKLFKTEIYNAKTFCFPQLICKEWLKCLSFEKTP